MNQPVAPEAEQVGPARTMLAGMNSASPMMTRLLNSPNTHVTRLTDVPAMAVMTTEAVDLEFTGARSIPQLRIRGRLESVVATDPEQMPFALAQVALPPQEAVTIEAVYRFTTEEIGQLVAKGLYLDGFGPSETWTNLAMELPVAADMVIIAPERTGEPPIVGVAVNKLCAIDTSTEHSRYKFADAFGDYRGELIEQGILGPDDIPGESLEAELSEDGFDFVDIDSANHTPAIEMIDPRSDLEGARAQMAALLGERLGMGDTLALMREAARERIAQGDGARARAGLSRRDEQESLEAFNAGMRERVQAFGARVGSSEKATLSDDDLMAALGENNDSALELDDDFEFDFDVPEDSSVAAPTSVAPTSVAPTAAATPVSDGPARADDLELDDFDDGYDFGDAGSDTTPQQVQRDASDASTDGLDMGELIAGGTALTDKESAELYRLEDQTLDDEEADDEQEKARKNALRARRARLAARRAQDRARRASALEAAAVTAPVIAPEPIEAPRRHRRREGGIEMG